MFRHPTKGLSQKVLKWLSVSIVVLSGLYFFYFFIVHQQAIARLRSLPSQVFLVIFVLIFLVYLLQGVRLFLISSIFGVNLQAMECFGLIVLTDFANYLVPFRGGLLLRGFYLKRQHALPYGQFVVSLAVLYTIEYMVATSLALALLPFLPFRAPVLALGLLLLVLLVGTGSLLVGGSWVFRPFSAWRIFENVTSGFEILRSRKIRLFLIAAGELLLGVLRGFLFFYVFQAIGVPLSFLRSILIAALTLLSAVLSLTPGNIGIREAVIVSASRLVGVPFEESVLMALLLRVLNTLFVTIFAFFFGYKLLEMGPRRIWQRIRQESEVFDGS